MGIILLYAREYDRSIETLRETLELDPSFPLVQIILALPRVRPELCTRSRLVTESALAIAIPVTQPDGESRDTVDGYLLRGDADPRVAPIRLRPRRKRESCPRVTFCPRT